VLEITASPANNAYVNRNHSQPSKARNCPTCDQLRRQLKGLRARNLSLVQRAQRAEALIARSRVELHELEQLLPAPPMATSGRKSRTRSTANV